MRAHRRTTAIVLGLVLGACTATPAPAPTETAAPATPSPTPDPDIIALQAQLDEVGRTLEALSDALADAASGDAGALQDALSLLAADTAYVLDPPPLVPPSEAGDGDTGGDDPIIDAPDSATQEPTPDDTTDDTDAQAPAQDGDATPLAPAGDGPAPFLPGPEVSRSETVAYGDLLTRTLAAARSAGAAGEAVQRWLADPAAGDLGSWQRAPGDLLRLAGEAGATGDLAAAESAVLALDGELPRVLAWVVHGIRTPQDAADAAARAITHLALVELTFEDLR